MEFTARQQVHQKQKQLHGFEIKVNHYRSNVMAAKFAELRYT